MELLSRAKHLPLAAVLASACGDASHAPASTAVLPSLAASGASAAGALDNGGGRSDALQVDATQSPVYVLHTRVNTADDTQQSFLVTVPSIEAGASFDLQHGVELSSGDVSLASIPGTPLLYTGSCSEPTITRWEVGDDGSLQQGPSLSFANLGFTDACFDPAVTLTAERAYYLPFQSGDPYGLRVLPGELVHPLSPDLSNLEDVVGENGFLWWKWEIGSAEAEQILGQTPGNFTVLVFSGPGQGFNVVRVH